MLVNMGNIASCGAIVVVVVGLMACSGDGTTATGAGAEAGAGTEAGAGGDGSAQLACVDAINAYRKSVGSPALTRWMVEESCTDGQAKSDASSGAAHGAFGQCMEFAQDECPGWPGPADAAMVQDCLKAMWAEGPGGGHYENMKNAQYTQVSCGFYTSPAGKVWAVQNFK